AGAAAVRRQFRRLDRSFAPSEVEGAWVETTGVPDVATSLQACRGRGGARSQADAGFVSFAT
ncbi:MAG TPA: hypothetical protein VK777_14090, partial [Reyranella sp.]|nr:hypothetical protein [Reyranella sp.]